VGCGDAFHSVHFVNKVKQFFGVDVAGSLINIAVKRAKQEKLENTELSVCSVLDLEYDFKGMKFVA
jgi:ubiquinone/menaquinone biosynthesis C-methylase UbiE